ncbi:MAG: peptide methionine sulfoxide reductase [Bacteroidetes bacterium]|nr:peptide methionine sulfoxide reductase [Bacteroidota bacterium]
MQIHQIPQGYSEANYRGKRYSLTRTDRAGGRAISVYAKELGGNDFISFNYYRTKQGGLLRPCEMPKERILTFLEEVQLQQ